MIKLFTHDDLDGVGCSILAKLVFGDNVDVEYCNYNNINEKVTEYLKHDNCLVHMYITDISVNDNVAKLLDQRGNVTLLDHHPTATNLNKYPWCEVTIERNGIKTSGTELFYYHLAHNGFMSDQLENNKSLDRFVDLVRDYDTWRWTELGEDGRICKQVNDLLDLYGTENFIKWCINEILDDVFPKLCLTDELLLNIKQDEINKYVENKNKQLITASMCGKIYGFVFAEKFTSELGNRLCMLHPEIDFIAIINMGNRTVSYRTVKDNIDLGKDIARLFGGGGHPKAAGSQFEVDVFSKIISEIFN